MPTRPLIETGTGGGPAAPETPTPAKAAAPAVSESPLVTQLPSWDLVPADTLLVRRRPAKP